ncbi:MAG: SPFH domain-containing protein [Planctomycetota bacterium]
MSKLIATIVGLILLLVLVLFSTTYTVPFTGVAIQSRFGETNDDSVKREPGLKFRLPVFADKITMYDTRLRLIESPIETVKTADDQQVLVKAFLLWRVDREGDGPLRFMRSFETEEIARDDISDDFRSAILRMGQYEIADLLGNESALSDAEELIRQQLEDKLAAQGVIPVQVGVSQFLLPPNSARAVLERMKATRERLATAERSKGDAEARSIEEDAKNQVNKILAFASARAAEIQAQGNEAAAEYLEQMGEEEEFAIFLTWLDTLEATLGQYTTLFLDTRMAPWHLMDQALSTDDGQIPLPMTDGVQLTEIMTPATPVTDEESGE